MTKPLLSICIPTYNRALMIKEAIDSILAQVDERVMNSLEIIVSDNASTDETRLIISNIVKKAKIIIKYFENEENIGPEANFLLAVERASGQYVWLLGSDDLLADGALKNILNALRGNDLTDIYFGEKEDFYLTADRPMRFRRIMDYNEIKTFNFKDKRMLDEYFKANKRLIAGCNFISNIIFSREKWLQVKDKQKYVGSQYLQVFIFQSILWGHDAGTMTYLPWPIVKRRWGNDGTIEPEARLKQDVSSYRRIAAAVFSDNKYIRLIDDLVIRNDGFSWAVRVKLQSPKRYIFCVLPFLFGFYGGHYLFWFKLVPLVFIPNFLLAFMRGFYRKQVKGEPIGMKELIVGRV